MATSTVEKTIEEAQAALTVKRAFGEPFEAHGLTIVPAARVAGAGGGGGGKEGSRAFGTGFGLVSQPLGVYVIDGHDAHWVPVTAPNPLITLLMAPITAFRAFLFGRPVAPPVKAHEIPIHKAAPKRATTRKRAVHQG